MEFMKRAEIARKLADGELSRSVELAVWLAANQLTVQRLAKLLGRSAGAIGNWRRRFREVDEGWTPTMTETKGRRQSTSRPVPASDAAKLEEWTGRSDW